MLDVSSPCRYHHNNETCLHGTNHSILPDEYLMPGTAEGTETRMHDFSLASARQKQGL
ncbi:Uncharacterised protein [Klebsiella pneumoniae]|nr:Uncharacterised protein [Klebsiella pneumoniae]